MLRIHNSLYSGWSTLKNEEDAHKMSDIINRYIEVLPVRMCIENEKECNSVQVHMGEEMVKIDILKNCPSRYEENCQVQEFRYCCWKRRGCLIWEKNIVESRKGGHVINAPVYMKQAISRKKSKACGTRELFELGESAMCGGKMQIISRSEGLCNIGESGRVGQVGKRSGYKGSMSMMQITVNVSTLAVSVEFKYKKREGLKKKNQSICFPRPVNICYTGSIYGNMSDNNVLCTVQKSKKKGPCGSEMHIDTSMGVMQIFSNNSGYRKITCKAFQNKKEADFIVDYVCHIVRSPIINTNFPTLAHKISPPLPTKFPHLCPQKFPTLAHKRGENSVFSGVIQTLC